MTRTVALFVTLALSTWFFARHRFEDRLLPDPPHAVGGDEPHYLLMVNALLEGDGFDLTNAYIRARRGGPELGARLAGKPVDRHVILVDPRTGEHADFMDVYDVKPGGYQPCEPAGCIEFRRRNDRLQNAREAPLHPPLMPALVAAVLAPLRPANVEAAMGNVLLACSLLAMALFHRATRSAAAVLLCALASPWLVYSRSYFAETTAGLVVVAGLWALAGEQPVLAALFAGFAAALKPQYAVVGVAWVLHRAVVRRDRAALWMLAVLAACGAAVMAQNHALAHTPLITATIVDWHVPLSRLWHDVLNLDHGVLLFAPWTLLGFLGAFAALRKAGLAGAAGWAVLLNLLLLSSLGITGEACYGPRYWIAFLPPLAVCAVDFVRPHGKLLRGVLVGLAVVSAAIAMTASLVYPYVWAKPPWLSLGAFL